MLLVSNYFSSHVINSPLNRLEHFEYLWISIKVRRLQLLMETLGLSSWKCPPPSISLLAIKSATFRHLVQVVGS